MERTKNALAHVNMFDGLVHGKHGKKYHPETMEE